MATLQRKICRRAIRHADVGSKTHAEDVKENNRRRSLFWIGVEQDLEDQHRIIPALGGGMYFVRDHPKFGAFEAYLASVAADAAAIEGEFAPKLEAATSHKERDELDDSKKRKINVAHKGSS